MKPKQTFLIAFLLFALVGVGIMGLKRNTLTQVETYPRNHVSTSQTANDYAGAVPVPIELVQPKDDTVRNPYAPPVRHPPQANYAQLGYLENGTVQQSRMKADGSEKVPLFGKPCPTQRRKWLYYATFDNGIKLPVEVNGRNCTVSPGCDELQGGDSVKVDGHPYIVRLYESDMYEYNPFVSL